MSLMIILHVYECICISQQSRPDIVLTVNQCARFTHNPKHSHAIDVKIILRYLRGTKDKVMYFKYSISYNVDCYLYNYFGGLWRVEDDQDPICIKSRTGFLIIFM